MSSQKSSRFPRSRAAAVRNRVPGKHERGRVLPWSALAAAVFGIAITLAFSLQSASQSQAVGTDEITIASSAANTNVPLATNFTVTLSVTTSTALYKSIQWELAYGANIGFVSAVYNCSGAPISFPSETETAPTEGNASDLGVPLAPLKILGSGANCASLSAAYAGSNALATFVTVTLQCLSNGATSVFAVDATAASDPNFGTSLGDKNGSNIPTTLSPTFNAGTFGTRAGFNITCGAASATNTPVPATNTPTNTPIPANTSTSTTTATATNTVAGPTNTPPPVATNTPTNTATPIPSSASGPDIALGVVAANKVPVLAVTTATVPYVGFNLHITSNVGSGVTLTSITGSAAGSVILVDSDADGTPDTGSVNCPGALPAPDRVIGCTTLPVDPNPPFSTTAAGLLATFTFNATGNGCIEAHLVDLAFTDGTASTHDTFTTAIDGLNAIRQNNNVNTTPVQVLIGTGTSQDCPSVVGGTSTPSPTNTATSTPTETKTAVPTATSTNTPTNTVVATNTPTETATTVADATDTPTQTPTNTAIAATETATEIPTNTAVPGTETPTETVVAGGCPGTGASARAWNATQTASPVATKSSIATTSPASTSSPQATASPAATRTRTVVVTETPATETPTCTPTATPTETPTETSTATSTSTATQTPTSTATSTSTSTSTATAIQNTQTAVPTSTRTQTTSTSTRTAVSTSTTAASPSVTSTVVNAVLGSQAGPRGGAEGVIALPATGQGDRDSQMRNLFALIILALAVAAGGMGVAVMYRQRKG